MRHIPFTKIPHPKNLCHILNQESLDRLRNFDDTTKSKSNFRLLRDYFYHLRNSADSTAIPEFGKYVFVTGADNLKWSTQNVMDKLEGVAELDILKEENRPSKKYEARIAFLMFPVLICYQLFATGYFRKTINCLLQVYIEAYAMYFWYRKAFKQAKDKIEFVILSNDHYREYIAINIAAKQEGIKTCYIQHAGISELFPPLEFSYAFLDGKDSLCTYDKIGESATKAYLVGINRFDGLQQNTQIDPNDAVIGLATNALMNIGKLKQLLEALKEKDHRILLRPHPGHGFEEIKNLIQDELQIELSNGKKENVTDYLKRIDVLIAGDSYILLDAAVCRKRPFYYPMSDEFDDYYGFISNQLLETKYVDVALLASAIDQHIKDPDDSFYQRVKRYCATVRTTYENRSAQLIVDLMKQIETKSFNQIAPKWKKVKGLQILEAFELDENVESAQ